MRRQAQEEIAEAARRRLELLSRELAQAGLAPDEPVTAELPPVVQLHRPSAAPIPDPGRHARSRSPAALTRMAAWAADRLPPSIQGRVGLGPAHVALIALVVALGLSVAAVVALRSGGSAQPVPVAAPAAASSPLVPAKPVASATTADVPVVVDIAGKVRRPGVATLPAGSRVVDALKQAGGAKPGVSLTALNLARVLVDGEQILVGVPAAGVAASAAVAPGAPAPSGQLVNLNSATAEQLDTLPGVGPVTAQKILDWRSRNGAFSSVDELLEVDGIGEKTLADLAPFLTL
ncbi:MAG: ComEA family DNA-binding protein [Marmoricola sp.]|jgi:competence protein ComEA|nr:ComEA family DNA-binding protein [Marmoricola sp.]